MIITAFQLEMQCGHEITQNEGFGYAVFGQVVEGMDVVKKINWKVIRARPGFPELPQGRGSHQVHSAV
ncbi:MAG: peptidylprolyl isomerase [Desulfovermiculus sp.]